MKTHNPAPLMLVMSAIVLFLHGYVSWVILVSPVLPTVITIPMEDCYE
jgi:hypothetical protein